MIRFRKINHNLKERLPCLIEAFRKNPDINALYIFGSYARDKIKPLSDIDIAVLLKKSVSAADYWDIKLKLLNKSGAILGTDEIDFVVLNEAPFELRYNILKEGKILFCRNEKERGGFQEKAVLDYLDTHALREEGFFHLKERIREGRFGNDEGKHKEDFEFVKRFFGETARNR
ncbi:MAG: hypothetical protein A3I73_04230 [Omnitrophica bacterium RIFCSPLOWO2_02_FULL_45_16]|nr:MAG: hypothetical protein A3K16_04910 [Omnitrophica bacterium RIFCSPLOWO2_01_FULL_45_24]OGX01073.1 MAG: hypothetical protein A3I73_04230 [Omnitrophica bacterium RIFCSPLOWO2_02_FULL_45_16]